MLVGIIQSIAQGFIYTAIKARLIRGRAKVPKSCGCNIWIAVSKWEETMWKDFRRENSRTPQNCLYFRPLHWKIFAWAEGPWEYFISTILYFQGVEIIHWGLHSTSGPVSQQQQPHLYLLVPFRAGPWHILVDPGCPESASPWACAVGTSLRREVVRTKMPRGSYSLTILKKEWV